MADIKSLTPAEKATADLKAALDSVKLINEAVAAGTHNDQINSRVEANWKHIELVLKRENVIADTTDKSAYTAAVAAGKAFYTSPAK
jgi:hypothetical protein